MLFKSAFRAYFQVLKTPGYLWIFGNDSNQLIISHYVIRLLSPDGLGRALVVGEHAAPLLRAAPPARFLQRKKQRRLGSRLCQRKNPKQHGVPAIQKLGCK